MVAVVIPSIADRYGRHIDAVPVIQVDEAGAYVAPGAGGGGTSDATAANQTTEIARLTSLLAALPASLGIKAAAASLSVALSTEDRAFIDGLEGFVDGLEALLTTQAGYVDGLEGLATTLNGLLTTQAGYLDQLEGYIDGLEGLTGALTEAAPASDTASSGLNGRLQRIAQNLTAAQVGLTYTDASIASAAGSSETVAAASATRKLLNISNPDTTTWWINESGGTAAANGAGCFELPPGARWTPRPAPTNIVKGIGTAASKLSVVTG